MQDTKVTVIGAGFSGLAVSYALAKKGAQVVLCEAGEDVGGLLGSEQMPWGLVERAANAIRASENVEALGHDLGLSFLPTKRASRNRYIWRHGPKRWPLTLSESIALGWGLVKKDRPLPKESLQSYLDRRFGEGVSRHLISPALQGIFAAEASALSAKLVWDYFFKYKTKASKKHQGSLSFDGGMGALVKALKVYLQAGGVDIQLQTEVRHLPTDQKLVLATPADVSAKLLRPLYPHLAEALSKVRYLPVSSVTLGYIKRPKYPRGFGCLFPRGFGIESAGVLWNRDIFSGRGPAYTETWILQSNEVDEDRIMRTILEDRKQVLAEEHTPDFAKLYHWPKAIPLYSVEHEVFLNNLVLPPQLGLVGNYMGALGLAKILDQSFEVAERILLTRRKVS